MVPYGRKSGTEHLKEKQKSKKKKCFGAPSRSIKFYGRVPRVEICNEITTCFPANLQKSKPLFHPLYSFFIYQMGENLSKRLVS